MEKGLDVHCIELVEPVELPQVAGDVKGGIVVEVVAEDADSELSLSGTEVHREGVWLREGGEHHPVHQGEGCEDLSERGVLSASGLFDQLLDGKLGEILGEPSDLKEAGLYLFQGHQVVSD